MTVQKLIDYLKQCPPEALVFTGKGSDDYSDELAANYVTPFPDETEPAVFLTMEGPYPESL